MSCSLLELAESLQAQRHAPPCLHPLHAPAQKIFILSLPSPYFLLRGRSKLGWPELAPTPSLSPSAATPSLSLSLFPSPFQPFTHSLSKHWSSAYSVLSTKPDLPADLQGVISQLGGFPLSPLWQSKFSSSPRPAPEHPPCTPALYIQPPT